MRRNRACANIPVTHPHGASSSFSLSLSLSHVQPLIRMRADGWRESPHLLSAWDGPRSAAGSGRVVVIEVRSGAGRATDLTAGADRARRGRFAALQFAASAIRRGRLSAPPQLASRQVPSCELVVCGCCRPDASPAPAAPKAALGAPKRALCAPGGLSGPFNGSREMHHLARLDSSSSCCASSGGEHHFYCSNSGPPRPVRRRASSLWPALLLLFVFGICLLWPAASRCGSAPDIGVGRAGRAGRAGRERTGGRRTSAGWK